MIKTQPSLVVYVIEQNGLSERKETTVLRLILPVPHGYYIYLDFPKGAALRETAIPIRKDKFGNRTLEDQDIIGFIKSVFGKDLNVCSFWTT